MSSDARRARPRPAAWRCWPSSVCADGGLLRRALAAPRGKRVIVLGFDGMDHAVATRLMAEGKLPNLSRLAESRRLCAARDLGAAAEPGGLVRFHHRHGRRRPRHLRLRAPRSRDHAALPVDQPGRVLRGLLRHRQLEGAGAGGQDRAAAPRHAVLGGPGGQRRRKLDRPHAGQLPALGHRFVRVERHGHAGRGRLARRVLVLHLGAVRLRGRGHQRRRDLPGGLLGGHRRGHPLRSAQRLSAGTPQAVDGLHGACRPGRAAGQAGGRRRAAAAEGRRVERLAAGLLPVAARRPAGHRAVLSQVGATRARALRDAVPDRSRGPGDADLDARRLRRRAGRSRRSSTTPRACPRTPRR